MKFKSLAIALMMSVFTLGFVAGCAEKECCMSDGDEAAAACACGDGACAACAQA